MTSRIRSVLLTLSVIAAGLAGAVVIEHAAIAHGQQLAHDDAGSGSGSGSSSVAAVVIIPTAAITTPVVVPLPQTADPLSTLGELVQDARTGKGRLAIGSAIVMLVWFLRFVLLKRVAWFQTKIGGYTLGFGVPTLLYVGGGIVGNVPVTLNLICDAAMAGFAASGKLEALRDLIANFGAPSVKTTASTLLVTILGVGLGVTLATSCQSAAAQHAGNVIVDCSKAETAGAIGDLIGDFGKLASDGKPDWSAIEAQAVAHGLDIGGCALAQFTQHLLAPKVGVAAPSPDIAQHAHDTLEHYRATKANGATFRTADGDL